MRWIGVIPQSVNISWNKTFLLKEKMTASNGHECVSKKFLFVISYILELFRQCGIFCFLFYHIVIESEIRISKVYTY